jgi:putative peptidoglycan lipid II flippase
MSDCGRPGGERKAVSRYEASQTTGIVISTVWVIGLSIVAKALALIKDIVVAARFGTSAEMDSYLVALTIPALVIAWCRSPIRSGFVPLFTERLERDGERRAWSDAGIFMTDFLLLILVATVVVLVLAPLMVSLVAPGFGESSHALATSLTRVMALSVLFSTMAGLFANILHCYRNFAIPGLGRPLNNVIMILAAVFLTRTHGIHGLAYGILLGSIAHAAVQLPSIRRRARGLTLRIDFRHPMFLGVMRLALPLFIGMAGAKLDDVVDRVFASMLAEGSISGLSYALRLIELPKEILIVGFSTVLFPFFSTMAARGRIDELADKLMAAMRIAFFILLPASIGMAVLGEPLVRLIFQRGAFDDESMRFTVSALLLYTPTIWALGISSIMTSAFIAMKDTKRPVIAGFVRLGVKVGLVLVFVRMFESAGVALSTSVSHVFKLVLFFFLLPKQLRSGRYPALFRSFLATALATAVMAVVLRLLSPVAVTIGLRGSITWQITALGGMAVVGTGVYWAAARVLAPNELREMLKVSSSGIRSFVTRMQGKN